MGDELTSLLDMFHACKKAGKSATLTMSTKGGKAKVKFEAELDNAMPSSLSTTSPQSASAPSLPGCQAAGDRHRPRGSAVRRAKANARAALHQAFQALPFPGGDYSAAPGPPDPSPAQPLRPFHLHPSPTDENRRLIMTVDRKAGFQPTFSQLDGEGDRPLALPSLPHSLHLSSEEGCLPPRPPPLPSPALPPPSLTLKVWHKDRELDPDHEVEFNNYPFRLKINIAAHWLMGMNWMKAWGVDLDDPSGE